MATTTSTQDSGLLDLLNPVFAKDTGAKVTVHAKGSGAALQMAMNKKVDLVFVHSRTEEDKFIADGYGVNRRDVMYNDFVVVGPNNDPAGLKGVSDVTAAFCRLKAGGEMGNAQFISRNDASGTHHRELDIWGAACIRPALLTNTAWYKMSGKGMGETLKAANETAAYTLADRGTWLKLKKDMKNLSILLEGPLKAGDPRLMNPYGIIAVNPMFNASANYTLAMAYIAFVTSNIGQKLISKYKFNGDQLFVPDTK
ncbi:substrate-binding domain-containing protein [Desulfurivibrio sp. C05AmB]|uniref:substrate-binding domain-containing protein n=1 Tax=Desulfurivibrio sp. C05AmB TaxID=3374371 RepID=UPI00376EB9EA